MGRHSGRVCRGLGVKVILEGVEDRFDLFPVMGNLPEARRLVHALVGSGARRNGH